MHIRRSWVWPKICFLNLVYVLEVPKHTVKRASYLLMMELTPSQKYPLRDPVHFLSLWFSTGATARGLVLGKNPIMITHWAFLLELHIHQKRPLLLIKNACVETLPMRSCKMPHSGAVCCAQQRFARMDKSGFCRAVIQQKSPLSHINDCNCGILWKKSQCWRKLRANNRVGIWLEHRSFASAGGDWQLHRLLVNSDCSQRFQWVHFLWWKKTCLLAKRMARKERKWSREHTTMKPEKTENVNSQC